MKATDLFLYTIGDFKYYLEPDWIVDDGLFVVRGAYMFKATGMYCGYWAAHNMPLKAFEAFKRWARYNRSVEIGVEFGKANKQRFKLLEV